MTQCKKNTYKKDKTVELTSQLSIVVFSAPSLWVIWFFSNMTLPQHPVSWKIGRWKRIAIACAWFWNKKKYSSCETEFLVTYYVCTLNILFDLTRKRFPSCSSEGKKKPISIDSAMIPRSDNSNKTFRRMPVEGSKWVFDIKKLRLVT